MAKKKISMNDNFSQIGNMIGSMTNSKPAAKPKPQKVKKSIKKTTQKRSTMKKTINHKDGRTKPATQRRSQHKDVMMTPETMKKVKTLANLQHISANDLINIAIMEYLDKEYRPAVKAAASKLKDMLKG